MHFILGVKCRKYKLLLELFLWKERLVCVRLAEKLLRPTNIYFPAINIFFGTINAADNYGSAVSYIYTHFLLLCPAQYSILASFDYFSRAWKAKPFLGHKDENQFASAELLSILMHHISTRCMCKQTVWFIIVLKTISHFVCDNKWKLFNRKIVPLSWIFLIFEKKKQMCVEKFCVEFGDWNEFFGWCMNSDHYNGKFVANGLPM